MDSCFKESPIVASIVKPQLVLKYDAEVLAEGRIELLVPYAEGERVVVFVVSDSTEPFNELTEATESSLAFWDNPLDDQDWNNA